MGEAIKIPDIEDFKEEPPYFAISGENLSIISNTIPPKDNDIINNVTSESI